VARILPADEAGLLEAASMLRRGGLVAFPTETVYGLGALAFDPRCVRAIFEAKGRPSTNPVIVHVLELPGPGPLVASVPGPAVELARAFWPGPLTLVLARGREVPDVVTAGGDTVALRSPAHPVARALLGAVGAPVAAPSANRSSGVSPTTAAHVEASLGDRIELILDGGPCEVGIESTVLDLCGEPRVLRPGAIPREALARVLGETPGLGPGAAGPLRSPGLLTRHYAPGACTILVEREAIEQRRAELEGEGLRVGVLACGQARGPGVELPDDPDGYAQGLYGALHALDASFQVILIERPPTTSPWEAVLDRLRRAVASG
jgi:L-threonylcarbamoyladenylate synthase